MPDHAFLIGLLYEGLSEPEPWSAFANAMCARFDALACSILIQSGRSPVPVAAFRAGGAAQYRARYWNKLYLVDPFVGLPADTPITFAHFARMQGRGPAADARFLAAIDSPHILGIDLELPGAMRVRFRLTRANHKPDFAPEELAACSALVPHMKRAFDLFLRLARAERDRDSLGQLPDMLGQGIVRVDWEGRVIEASEAAAAILARGDGLAVAAGAIVAHAAAGNAALHGAIRSAGGRGEPRLIRIERAAGLPLAVVVMPGGSAHAALAPDALLLLLDPDRVPAADRAELATLLGLTPAEARLAALIGQGLSLGEAAAALGVRMTTVRAQLRTIFAKTGVARQSELVRVVLNYAAALPAAGGIGRSSTMSSP